MNRTNENKGLTISTFAPLLDTTSLTMVDPNVHLPSSPDNPKVLELTSRHLAYIVYTSGSTEKPKGVMIEHQGVVNFALSRINDYGLDASSKMLQFSSLNFDLSVIGDIYSVLFQQVYTSWKIVHDLIDTSCGNISSSMQSRKQSCHLQSYKSAKTVRR
jgi:acyl-CoA synthetase (AMP-forming)/AMP-acid ligase II